MKAIIVQRQTKIGRNTVMEDSFSVQQQEQTGERTADDAASVNMFASELEKTEDLLLSPERLLDQAKGEELFLLCVVVATCC